MAPTKPGIVFRTSATAEHLPHWAQVKKEWAVPNLAVPLLVPLHQHIQHCLRLLRRHSGCQSRTDFVAAIEASPVFVRWRHCGSSPGIQKE